MPSIKRKPSSTPSTPSKRRKATISSRPASDDESTTYGAAGGTQADWAALVSDSSLSTQSASTRPARFKSFPSLASCCIRRFASSFRYEYGGQIRHADKRKKRVLTDKEQAEENERTRMRRIRIEGDMAALPEFLREKIWDRLMMECPELLSMRVISLLATDQSNIRLPGAILPAIYQAVSDIQSRSSQDKSAPKLRDLTFVNPDGVIAFELSDAGKASDDAVAAKVVHLRNLRKLNLRGCTNAGPLTTRQISHFSSLTHLNLSATSLDLDLLTTITKSCINLEVLKIADCKKMSANTQRVAWEKWLDSLKEGAEKPLGKLKSLKLRHSLPYTLEWPFFYQLLETLPALESLDISHVSQTPTYLKGFDPTRLHLLEKLTKLNLIGTRLKLMDIKKILEVMSSKVETVSFSVTPENGVAKMFDKIASVLDGCERLKKFSIACDDVRGIAVMGGIADVLTARSRTLEYIDLNNARNLNGIENYIDWSSTSPPVLKTINLSYTDVTDAIAEKLAMCTELQSLDLSGTKITEPVDKGLFRILDGCPMLDSLELTSCRGVPVAQRRNFFDVYMARKALNEG